MAKVYNVIPALIVLRLVLGEIKINVYKNKTKDRIVKCAIEIASEHFDYRQSTAVLNEDVDVDFVSKFLKSYQGVVTVDMQYYKQPSKQVIVMVETFESFVKIVERLKPDLKGKTLLNSKGKFLVLLFGHGNNIHRVTKMLWNYNVLDVVIITSKNGKNYLYTYFPYKNHLDCQNTDPVLIEYKKKNLLQKTLFPKKLRNMQGCPLYISTNKLYHPENEQKIALEVFKKEMVRSLKEIMNFTPIISTRDYISIDSDRAKNWSDSLNDVISGSANISTCTIPLGVDKLGILEHSLPYFTVRLVWIAPPITPAPAWWRLFSPLSGYLWLLTLIVVFFVKCLPLSLKLPPFRKFSYRYFKNLKKLQGTAIKSWGIMFGQPIKIVPKRFRDFYILSLWLWYTFVLRSVYQSVLIGALKTDAIVGNFATLKETVEEGYGFGGRAGIYTHFEFDPLIREGFEIIPEGRFEEMFQDVINGKVKFVLCTSMEYAYAYCLANGKKEEDCGHALPDSILTLSLVIWMKVNSPFAEPLSVWLQRLIETGLLERDKNLKTNMTNQLITDPAPLNSHQTISCILCLVTGYLISIAAFVFEIIRFQLNKRGIVKY